MAEDGVENRLNGGPMSVVTDSSGERLEAAVRDLEDGYEVRLGDNRTLRVPLGLLEATAEGEYRLHESFAALSSAEYSADTYGVTGETRGTVSDDAAYTAGDFRVTERSTEELESAVVPVVAERLNVSKRQLERGRVVVHKRVVSQQTTVDEPLMDEQIEINRIPVNKIVEAAEPERTEGDTLIIPLYEEVLVVEKRLVLVEELHIIKRVREHRDPQQITLRREEVDIERQSGDDSLV